ncbi:MAG: LysM peptidoglycan-binding domain-containing protein [Actinomycetes bacterium]
MRRLLALMALVILAAVPPALLLTLGYTDWSGIQLWSASDVRVLLVALTMLGWLAWAAWMLSLALELAVALSGRRLRLPLPGLAGPRALASVLIAAIVATGAASGAHAAPSPIPLAARASADSQGAERVSATRAPITPVHRVLLGDDLWSLAERYYGDGAQWRQVAEANPALLGDPLAQLTPGAELAIPTPSTEVRVREGDTLRRLAGRHLGDPARWPEIYELNRQLVKDPDLIRVGWVLRVPRSVAPADVSQPPPPPRPSPRVEHAEHAAAEPASPTPSPAPPAELPRTDPAPGQPDDTEGDMTGVDATTSEDQTDIGAVAGLVGGLSALAASAVLGGIGVRRRIQAQARPVGRRFVQPVGELARYEAALGRLVVDDPEIGRDQLLARAMRHLSAHWRAEGKPAPTLRMASVGPDDVAFEFARPPASTPEGFTLLGTSLIAVWSILRGLGEADAPVTFPALVTLGRGSDGRLLMVDVIACGVLGIRPDEARGADEVLSAMLVELSCAPWATELDLLVVTGDPGFADAAGEGRIVCEPDAEAGVAAVERLVAQRSPFTAPGGWSVGRCAPDWADALAAQVVLFESAPDAAQLARLEEALAHDCGIAAIAVVDADADADWTLTTDHAGVRLVDAGGSTALAQTVPAETRRALTGLYETASRTDSEPAAWWAAPQKEDDVNIIALRPGHLPVRSDGPRLGLLGPVELTGCAGAPPIRAVRQCIEYCAWLHLSNGGTAVQMTQALLVADGTRRSNLSRLRSWLGGRPDGTLFLPDAYSGRIALDAAVTSDWQDLALLTSGGVNRQPLDRLVAALQLVRGAPLADAAPGQWGWAEEFRADAAALIRDVGVVAARAARERGDLDTARWAANRALLAAPDDELLLAERIRTERAAGRLDEVRRLVERVTRTARVLGLDLLPETVDLCQEALEGRLRARA